MNQIRKFILFFKQMKSKEFYFRTNWGLVLEELITCFGGKYKLPIRSFTTKDLKSAPKNVFGEVPQITFCKMFTGNLEERPVLIKCYTGRITRVVWNLTAQMTYVLINIFIRDIVVTSQMSHHKNVLHLIGCCLESMSPVLVYEYAPGTKFLAECLCQTTNGNILPWKTRIKIAKDIANVLLYLHTSFPTPIIYGDLTPDKVMIDHCGVVKLFDFTFSIFLPPGEVQLLDHLGRYGGYKDPQCANSGLVTQKADVYSFGVLMLALFTGETEAMRYRKGTREKIHIRDYVEGFLESDHIEEIVDPKIFAEKGNIYKDELEGQLLDFLDLALRCTEYEGTNRPDMIDVANELRQMEKSVANS